MKYAILILLFPIFAQAQTIEQAQAAYQADSLDKARAIIEQLDKTPESRELLKKITAIEYGRAQLARHVQANTPKPPKERQTRIERKVNSLVIHTIVLDVAAVVLWLWFRSQGN